MSDTPRTVKDFSYEELCKEYIYTKREADQIYFRVKEIEKEMERRYEVKIEEARRGKGGDKSIKT